MAAGRVRVNGHVVTELGTRIDPAADRVEVDGRPVDIPPPRWLALHKPAGYLTTRRDPGGRPTVYDLLPGRYRSLIYVGRLDRDSEGLLLLTNQGDVVHRLLHPRHGVERVYDVDVEGSVSEAALRRLRDGVRLEDGIARAQRVSRRDTPRPGSLRLTLTEGRKREVRRLLAAVGHPVRRLVRVRYGPVSLGELPPGAWRVLSDEETRALSEPGRPDGRRADAGPKRT